MNSKLNLAMLVVISLLAAGCSKNASQETKDQKAKVDSELPKSAANDISLPGMKPGSLPAGCYMRAMIDGKKWEATEMMPDEAKLSLVTVSGKSSNSSIMFVLGRSKENVGKPTNLGASNQITYWGGQAFFVGAQSGNYTVTKMDDQFIEGTFNFTAEKDGRKVTCTDGEFRILAPAPTPSN